MNAIVASNTADVGAITPSVTLESNRFQHEPLDTTKRQIRLLRVRELTTHGELDCDIEIYDLDACGRPEVRSGTRDDDHDIYGSIRYRALSYMWGPASQIRTLSIHGKILNVSRNLYQFLHEWPSACARGMRQYRHPCYSFPPRSEGHGLLWIDQICIDQSNIAEKNHQVGLMTNIYKNCEAVIMWLRDPDNSLECSEAARHFIWRPKPEFLAPILSNPYFTRLWIVQEIILAPYVQILVEGCNWVLWTDAQAAAVHMSENNKQQLRAAGSNAEFLLQASKKGGFCKPVAWFFLSFHDCKCTEPRDKVFGLVGLNTFSLTGGKPRERQVDYERPIYDIFLEAAVEMHDYSARFQYEAKQHEQATTAIMALGISMGLDQITIQRMQAFMGLIMPLQLHDYTSEAEYPPLGLVTAVGYGYRSYGASTTSGSADSSESWSRFSSDITHLYGAGSVSDDAFVVPIMKWEIAEVLQKWCSDQPKAEDLAEWQRFASYENRFGCCFFEYGGRNHLYDVPPQWALFLSMSGQQLSDTLLAWKHRKIGPY